ncbi:TAXI family TRAP transporter solute-binding subunit [Bordetella genomosp. 4]|uniref:C4-dicarboxylate ABC transporter substrate-binding protein n=1 Tax=Bordetella genomosp. 4 TaxID=463044 RepID=A0A261U4B5_9BORD|nr:TAXI family TRAP transporter solute-binding subunit [Bordetella genomosp. 4]OZI48737.1 C4-dicarboxylate ABC transporter substrate-binding protein [Bordetella genomosp. 4]OZI56796.1 C4-dicarboxylate ABC transporter substrate-binding protein [Bordetella genomosp. 4]
MKLSVKRFACILGFSLLAVQTAGAENLSIATGGTGGVYYPIGGGMASILSKKVPGMEATAEVTGGSVDNLKLVGSDDSYIGMTMSDAALDAYQGKDKFKGNKQALRTLMIMYPNSMHVVTLQGKNIEKFADLKGKRISTGSPGSATEVMAFRQLEAAGLDRDKDVQRERLSVAESVNALKDNKIDAFFWVGGLPTAAVTDLANTPGTTLLMIDNAELVPAMNEKYGKLYVQSVIGKDVYRGMKTDNKNANVMNLLVANEEMDDKTAYNIVKTIFESRDDLIAVHKITADFALDKQKSAASPIPFHPGAAKYFQERGVSLD